jgi:4-hydroxy-4-methyl-2-oxoglutarate aldolase
MFQVGERPAPQPGLLALLEQLRQLGTATLGHLTDFGFAHGLQPLFRPAKVVGTAFTVHIPRLDSSAVHYALGMLERGEVLVIDTTGETSRACVGGGIAYAAMRAGAAGIVVDGPATDWEELNELRLPVWCRGISALTARPLALEGSVEVPIRVAEAVVHPGDVVFADSDGVFFLAPGEVAGLVETLRAREARSAAMRGRLDAGEKLPDITGVRARLDALRRPHRGANGHA